MLLKGHHLNRRRESWSSLTTFEGWFLSLSQAGALCKRVAMILLMICLFPLLMDELIVSAHNPLARPLFLISKLKSSQDILKGWQWWSYRMYVFLEKDRRYQRHVAVEGNRGKLTISSSLVIPQEPLAQITPNRIQKLVSTLCDTIHVSALCNNHDVKTRSDTLRVSTLSSTVHTYQHWHL